jgi:heparosan-N-sulfate-glucuronate 5-epimerase
MKLIFSGMALGKVNSDPATFQRRPPGSRQRWASVGMNLFPAPTMIEDDETLGRVNTSFDANGVVVVNVLSPDGPKPRYVPTTIAQFAMAHYDLFVKTGDQSHRKAMSHHVDWLMDNLVVTRGFGVWRYMHDYSGPGYDCRSPWVSCMAQGQGVSALIRAHDLEPDDRKATAARLAARSFAFSLKDGGVRDTDRHGCTIYKEFACPDSPTVLNGLIFGLIGLKEYSEYFHDQDAEGDFNAGIDGLKRHLAGFEVGVYPLFKWSRYDDRFIILAAGRYHRIHVRQLAHLFRITKDEFFLKYALRWKRYEDVYPRTPVYPLIYGLARRIGYRSQSRSLRKRRTP